MLKRAGSKLMLERLVITQGNFQEVKEANSKGSSLSSNELVALLRAFHGRHRVLPARRLRDAAEQTGHQR